MLSVGLGIQAHVRKLFKGSLAIRVVTAGSTNACEQELTALSNPFYDVERFGIHFVASPRHADMLLVTGPTPAGESAPTLSVTAIISSLTIPQFGSAREVRMGEVSFTTSGKVTFTDSSGVGTSSSPSASASASPSSSASA